VDGRRCPLLLLLCCSHAVSLHTNKHTPKLTSLTINNTQQQIEQFELPRASTVCLFALVRAQQRG
jgi:hypothetical protein